ncbi:O-antigen translocase [Pedobacter gandavensis]|uniref:O-antigen translocase n=1 Tax=Pedobacter gandavensis TaxID=2679963 RepID=UPI0029308785|nr:O-antigen translocase [Pedobacter gandavensis]
MEEAKTSYRQIVKTTTLFGGVQVIQILTSIIRGKLVAVLLGTAGMGINTLINSVITVIVQFASLGLNFSAVRDISQANISGDKDELNRTVKVFRHLMYYCAILGAVIIIGSSYWISEFTFGNNSYTWGFVWLSIVVVLNILNSSNITVLQGMQRLKDMAKASLIGSVAGLIFSVPFYYFYGENGIIPALVVAALITFSVSQYFSSKLKFDVLALNRQDTFKQGSEMAKLGIAMMLSTLIGSAVTYLVNAYIGKYGSIAEVGLYGAGISITNQYVSVIFTAMAVDYFPRLSAVCNDRKKVNEIVNQQAEIVVLIIAPLLIIMILTAPILIKVLLSKEFLVITGFVTWVAFALLFKAASFALGYISFAKGDKKTFFLFEGITGSLLILICNISGYKLGGLTGIAISILISYIIYLIAVNILASRLYGFNLEKKFKYIFLISILLLGSVFLITMFFSNLFGYLAGSLVLAISLYYSYSELNKRIGIKAFILSKIKAKILS